MEYNNKSNIEAYTDGSCNAKDRVGGWACVLSSENHYKELAGGKQDTTIGEMELLAIYKALKAVKRPYRHDSVTVHSDSQYAVNALSVWYKTWRKNNWITGKGTPVANRELLEDIILEIETRYKDTILKFKWVKGHAGICNNERADELAGLERNKLLLNKSFYVTK